MAMNYPSQIHSWNYTKFVIVVIIITNTYRVVVIIVVFYGIGVSSIRAVFLLGVTE